MEGCCGSMGYQWFRGDGYGILNILLFKWFEAQWQLWDLP